ncbi:hypothetical protein WJX74_010618 [Apatococcus lobatus]|uniref:Exonuclease domain-containing protein n=1 Tax=Apatococcus lobatus TaxID=904363 RepID=A0AAW1SB66_9CHLO
MTSRADLRLARSHCSGHNLAQKELSPCSSRHRLLRSLVEPSAAGLRRHLAVRTEVVVGSSTSWYTGQQSSPRDLIFALDVEWAHLGRNPTQRFPVEVCAIGASGSDFQTFCSPDEDQVSGLPFIGGVPRRHWQHAQGLEHVTAALAELLAGKVLVGYNLAADLRSLDLSHPKHLQRDLMRSCRMQRRSGQAPSLRQLAAQHLARDIQLGRHSAREDAQACLDLYMRFCQDDPDLVPQDHLAAYYLAQLNLSNHI